MDLALAPEEILFPRKTVFPRYDSLGENRAVDDLGTYRAVGDNGQIRIDINNGFFANANASVSES